MNVNELIEYLNDLEGDSPVLISGGALTTVGAQYVSVPVSGGEPVTIQMVFLS